MVSSALVESFLYRRLFDTEISIFLSMKVWHASRPSFKMNDKQTCYVVLPKILLIPSSYIKIFHWEVILRKIKLENCYYEQEKFTMLYAPCRVAMLPQHVVYMCYQYICFRRMISTWQKSAFVLCLYCNAKKVSHAYYYVTGLVLCRVCPLRLVLVDAYAHT